MSIDILVMLAAPVLLFVLLVGYIVYRSFRQKHSKFSSSVVGKFGRAESDLNPEGIILIDGEAWQAIAEYETVSIGSRILAVGFDGVRVKVRAVK